MPQWPHEHAPSVSPAPDPWTESRWSAAMTGEWSEESMRATLRFDERSRIALRSRAWPSPLRLLGRLLDAFALGRRVLLLDGLLDRPRRARVGPHVRAFAVRVDLRELGAEDEDERRVVDPQEDEQDRAARAVA